jgi:hypothetical protein
MQTQAPPKEKSNVLKIILVILLVIVILILLLFMAAFGWFWFADPLGLRTAIFNPPEIEETEIIENYDHPLLSESQEQMLESIGINPQVVPTEITPAMEDCARDALGNERVDQIIQGAAPNAVDLLKAQSCF